MNPTLWVVMDDEGLVLLHGGKGVEDLEFLASTIFLGYISVKRALEAELQAQMKELILPTDRYLIMIVPLPAHHLLFSLFPVDTPLGLARLGLKKLKEKVLQEHARLLSEGSPAESTSSPATKKDSGSLEREQWKKVLQFIRERTPDPAFFLKRLSLRTGIPEERLARGDLSPDEFHRVNTHLQSILGISMEDLYQGAES